MKNKLQTYFPIIRTRGEVLEELRENKELWKTFCGWKETCQQEYLDLCTGVKGIKLLYDTYFKAIMNPDTRPDRFNDFISEMLGQRVKVLKVLPNESARIAAESSLLVMDVVVQLEDGSIANVEVQKIGYLFPGERSACYSADLLLRQYKRAREVEINLLQEYTFVCLDIFNNIIHNKDKKIENKLEEWLVFLSQDDPDMIMKLLDRNPEFQKIYEEIYTLCLNMEGMMEMFSKELEIMDRNTVKLMIDEMEEELNETKRKAKKEVDEVKRKAKEEIEEAEKRAKAAEEETERLRRTLEEQKGKRDIS